ncbi:MAG: hypothetical protein AB1743_09980 [Actinomycetota bacterium]
MHQDSLLHRCPVYRAKQLKLQGFCNSLSFAVRKCHPERRPKLSTKLSEMSSRAKGDSPESRDLNNIITTVPQLVHNHKGVG